MILFDTSYTNSKIGLKTDFGKNKNITKSGMSFNGQKLSEKEEISIKVNSKLAESYLGFDTPKSRMRFNSESNEPLTRQELSNIKTTDGLERFTTEEKMELIELSKEDPNNVRKLISFEKNGKPLLKEPHITILLPKYKEHPEAVETLLNMETSQKYSRFSPFDVCFLLDTYLAHPKAVRELAKIETDDHEPSLEFCDIKMFAEDFDENPDFVEKFNMFEYLNKNNDWERKDIKYAIRLSKNPEIENFIVDNFDKIDRIVSLSSDNFVEIEMEDKKIHAQADENNLYKIIGVETQKNNGNIITTELKTADGTIKLEEFKKDKKNQILEYIETISDKNGKVLSRTSTRPNAIYPGVLTILKEVYDENENLLEVQDVGTIRMYGDKNDRKRIEKKFISPSGVESRQLILEVPKGTRTEFKVGNKIFNRVSKKIDDNTTETYVWGKKFVTKYNKDNIEVTVEKKGEHAKKIVLNDKQLDFSMMPIYKQLPGDYLYTMAKFKTKTGITDSILWENNASYGAHNNKIEVSLERANDPHTFAHEYGHMLDELPLNNLHADKKLKKIFSKELDAYKKNATSLNEEQIMYFISKEHRNTNGCLSEAIAESVAILSGLTHNENHLLLRAKILQENFPETIAYVGSKIEEFMQ